MKRLAAVVLALLVPSLGVACSDDPSGSTPPPDGSLPDGGGEGEGSIGPGDGGGDARPTGKTLSFLTLNLHGYHPTGEKERFFEDRSGNVTPAPSSPFYFTRQELERGNAARLDALAADLKTRLPDVIALQEVGAGSPDTARDCATFDGEPLADAPSANTAWRLASRLSADGYAVKVGCRGNIGWVTDASTFKDRRIVTTAGGKQVVYDFDSNPYPGGILVEGFALLWRAPLRAIEDKLLDVSINGSGERFKAELVALEVDASSWVLVVVVHGGHKVQHFEQAIALREAVSSYVAASPKRASLAGVVFLGDFNARLHRPKHPVFLDEPSSVPWEIAVPGEYSYEDAGADAPFVDLRDRMRALNASSYKTFATLPEADANARIDAAISRLRAFVKKKEAPLVFAEALWTANQEKRCAPPKTPFTACEAGARIDHVFFGGGLAVDEAHVLYTNADDHDLAGTFSDHPGIWATLRLPSR